MRIAVFFNIVGIALVVAAIWQGLDGQITAAVMFALAALW